MRAGPAQPLLRRLDEVRRGFAVLEGRRDAVARRAATLRENVAAAKGRLDAKPEVDALLEEMQEAGHRRTLGSYEAMLSAIAQDVLGPGVAIRLALGTERGLPSLDIEAEQDGARCSVLDGCGGSLNNVVSAGLRAIATMKSGLRPFLALDEADCWIRPGRVQLFCHVLRRLSERIGMQTLAVSHHDVSSLGGAIAIIGLEARREGVAAVVQAEGPAWPDEEIRGIRSIRLVNFGSIRDATIPLGPGVTAITGENNIGKSRFIRALRCVFYGGAEGGDGDIRHGQKQAEVEIALEYGRRLLWSRRPGRNPVTLWTLFERDGSVAEWKGGACRAGGRLPPDWLREALGLGRVDEMDLQVSRQAAPVFLLGETPSRRASVLSLGRESGYLRGMIERHRQNCGEDSALVRQGEAELAVLEREAALLDAILSRRPDLETLRRVAEGADALARTADATADKAAAIEVRGGEILAARGALERMTERLRAAEAMPDGAGAALGAADRAHWLAARISAAAKGEARLSAAAAACARLPGDAPVLPDASAPLAAEATLRRAEARVRGIGQARAALRPLPAAVPVPPDADRAEAMAARLLQGVEEANATEAALREAASAVTALERAREEALAEMDVCPVCGGGLLAMAGAA
ncbi:ATP-binding protein [Sabulicella glaciei]|uniref:ATP-binding protein n=1 Tax=Sabulicella glaciei TaxID=2984948 RepID=A0ABT3NPX5_9PROT|nr:ATP-binding protein [Roseococcus sp. MDT2-1-1]MCW8084210.1 ATP-binding protein [Roseococcus sp. MDT2-1-1]